MTTHIMALTYKPKINGVKLGKIKKTLRKDTGNRKYSVGDTVLMHGWGGKPYGSKWDWRERFTLVSVRHIFFSEDCIKLDDKTLLWDDEFIREMAKSDGIQPPTGEELKNVLRGKNKHRGWEGWYWELEWE